MPKITNETTTTHLAYDMLLFYLFSQQKRMKKFFATALLYFGLLATNFAGQAEELFKQANEAYLADDISNAILLYEQVAGLGFESFELEFNLGNAYFRQKKIGEAVLHYERALVLSPEQEDAVHNLSIATASVEKREQLPDFFLTDWWKKTRMTFGSGVWGGLALLLWWLGFGGLSLWKLGKNREQRKWGFYIGLVAILLSILPFALAWSRMSFEKNSKEAVVLLDDAVLKSAPDHAGSELFKLVEGEKVKLLDHLGGYWQVRLSNGEKGWVADGEVEEI
ncbi:MAG: tetratricopeptide repeat protein [Saprospiraceae bacterium]